MVTIFLAPFSYSQEYHYLGTHKIVLDNQSRIIPWFSPAEKAYDQLLRLRWNFIKSKVPASPGPAPRSLYPQYYFYCAFKNDMKPDMWMNDVGEKIPNWFESGRLYYAYTGDTVVLNIVKDLADYALEHGTSPSTFAWPGFPYTTTNAGDTIFRGFTSAKIFSLHEIQVDHAGEMGRTYYRLYLLTGTVKYLNAALKIANTLAAKVRKGSATQSPWPYRVIMSTGKVTSEYGANWTGCYLLLDDLIKAGLGNVAAYKNACARVRDFLLRYPMKTGFWTDGHSDTDVRSHTYKSNLSASNFSLFLFDNPAFDADWKTNEQRLIKWTEEYFITRCAPGEPSHQWGANIVGEQDTFLYKMDYQTARYAAACARWYAVSGDASYKEKAYRSLNWVTYCNDSTGKVFESPLSKGILSWWSDSYGEGPRMFYTAFAAIPEWAPPGENHILYSEGIIKNVSYAAKRIQYTATDKSGTEYLRITFMPASIFVNGIKISLRGDIYEEGYVLKKLENGDYAVTIKRIRAGEVIIL